MMFAYRTAIACLTLVLPSLATAGILVHLKSGTEIEAHAQSLVGDQVSLVIDHGTVELPASEIESIETVPDAVAPPQAQQSEDILSVAEALRRASESEALPANFVKTVANVESGLKPEALSPKGAIGLMQLMPETANDLGVKATSTSDNALGGAKYLRQLLIRYHGDARLALAAYNAGPAAVDRYHGIPPYPETIAYVNKVLVQYVRLENATKSASKPASGNRSRIEGNQVVR
jgi:hypothetical protein